MRSNRPQGRIHDMMMGDHSHSDVESDVDLAVATTSGTAGGDTSNVDLDIDLYPLHLLGLA